MSYNTHQRFRNKIFFSTVHIIKWMLLSLALGISQKRWEVMNFYNHFYDIVISLHNYHYIYLFIIIVVPIASLIKKITCFIQCSINSNIKIFFHSSKNRCSRHRVYRRYSSIFYTIYILHGTLDYLDTSLSVLWLFHFYRSLDSLGIIKKHRCIFVQMGMYLI